MSRSPSVSTWFQRLSARERRIIAAGALLSGLALLGSWALLPFARHYQEREAAISAQQSRLVQLRALVHGEPAAKRSLVSLQREHTELRRRLLTGSTPALAASNLQALLQSYADSSRVNLERVDPVAEPGTVAAHGLPTIPVRLSGQGDIYGLIALLERLQHGEKLLAVDELSLNEISTSAGRHDLLGFSVRLHAVYSPD